MSWSGAWGLNTGGGGSSHSGGGFDPAYTVDTFADLPAYGDHTGEYWLVNEQSGHWYTFNLKKKGIYKAEATEWNFKGIEDSSIPKEYDYYVTANSWSDLVTALESGDYATVFIPDGTYTCTDNEANPLNVHANVKRISGQSREGTIIDVDIANNANVQNFLTVGDDCVIENIHFDNPGGGYYIIRGTNVSPYTKITKVINCMFTNVAASAGNMIGWADVINCIGINLSSVGVYGRGTLATYCRYVTGCKTEYFANVAKASYIVANNYIYKCNSAVETSHVVNNNYVTSCYRGMTNCYSIGKDNIITNFAHQPYYTCTFNHTERDNTDNTKEFTFHYDNGTTGTEYDIYYQGKDGTVALLDDISNPVYADKSADYTITDADGLLYIYVTTGATDKTITLPTLADNDKRILTVKKVDSGAGNVIVDGEGAETIDGSANQTITSQYDSITIQSTTTEWRIN